MHGAFAQAHVTVMQLGIVQETLLEGPIHVWAIQMKLEHVQVGVCIVLESQKSNVDYPFS